MFENATISMNLIFYDIGKYIWCLIGLLKQHEAFEALMKT